METLIHKLNIESVAFLILCFSFGLTYFINPKLIAIIRYKNLMDQPGLRSSHTDKTPSLGGVAFFISIIFCLFLIHYFDHVDISFNILMAITILFFVGLKDDLVILSARSKVIAQLIAITFILLNPDLYIHNFYGFLRIYEIPLSLTFVFSYITTIFIINAYNLMDGIDGLAGLLGILIFIIYAILFYNTGLYFYFLLSIVGIGFLAAFLRYNLSKKRKIFMGDTGSMIVGLLIGLLTLRFLAFNTIQFQANHIDPKNSLMIVLAILFFPTVDVSRVIFMRLINKKGAFSADRCHMHHILIDKGLIHIKASIILTASSILIFTVVYLMNTFLSTLGLFILFLFITFFTYFILMILDSDGLAKKHRKKFKSLFPRSFQIREFRIRKNMIITLKRIFFKDLL